VHPDLAIQLAQWISPKFALQVSKWIRTLLTDGQVELLKNKDNELKNKDDELKLKNLKIRLLEDTYIKQQKRKNYPTKNVIYMLTTEDHKKNRLYIIGKACNLKNRLGNYNKTAEHEVVYYKNCESEKDMSAIETLVLKKLNKYREKANRDRFILPLENDISLFTNMINECINFFN
jgi:4-alpha-glucanotransferase